MTLTAIYAHLSSSDLTASLPWFEALFGRPPDAMPMAGLAEWHLGTSAGLQVFENPDAAGHGTVTLLVTDLVGLRKDLSDRGLTPGPVEPASRGTLLRLTDPDGNLVVLFAPDGV